MNNNTPVLHRNARVDENLFQSFVSTFLYILEEINILIFFMSILSSEYVSWSG